MAVELIDELEAGELSVDFEGEEPDFVLAWALERFAPRIAISSAFQIDGIALIDLAYAIDPAIEVFSVDTGRLPNETYELIEALREAVSRAEPEAARAERRRGVGNGRPPRPEPLLPVGRGPPPLLQRAQGGR